LKQYRGYADFPSKKLGYSSKYLFDLAKIGSQKTNGRNRRKFKIRQLKFLRFFAKTKLGAILAFSITLKNGEF
jgi:hypothetical protein